VAEWSLVASYSVPSFFSIPLRLSVIPPIRHVFSRSAARAALSDTRRFHKEGPSSTTNGPNRDADFALPESRSLSLAHAGSHAKIRCKRNGIREPRRGLLGSNEKDHRMVRFLHAADLHLGLRITRFDESACNRIGEARFEAIEQLRAAAAQYQVNFILIAGDIFDDHSVSRGLAERAFTLFEGQALSCPVYIIPGNHDPLAPGGVWDRDPWTREQPMKHVQVLRDAAPIRVPDLPVIIYPCPLRNRNSVDDPTAWIAAHPRTDDDRLIRIGLAHGSLKVLPSLPLDDHLIRRDAADYYGLDYLALGHWHKTLRQPSADGAERTAYSGTHEPMRFPDSGAGPSTGWSSYSSDGDAERFQDEGRGTALLVSIDEAQAPPHIETIETGRLRWAAEERDLTIQPFGEIISTYAERDNRELTLLRLKLSGVVDPEKFSRIDTLREIICNRYYPGSSLHADDVLVEPKPEQLRAMVGDGVLSRVVGKLQADSQGADVAVRRVADHALKLLYRIAWEEQRQ
jgi:DNA repair exonuclease SbcCD nuclease subunit